jgi:hypothetical protein
MKIVKPVTLLDRIMRVIGNVLILLLVAIVGVGIGFYYGWLEGRNYVNDRLVVEAFNSGYMTGNDAGMEKATKVFFGSYLEKHPYKIPLPCDPE